MSVAKIGMSIAQIEISVADIWMNDIAQTGRSLAPEHRQIMFM